MFKTHTTWFLFIAACAVLIMPMAKYPLSGADISFDMTSQSEVMKWTVTGESLQKSVSRTHGLSLKSNAPLYIISPNLGIPLNWKSNPYVKLSIQGSPSERRAGFLWFISSDQPQYRYFPVTIPPNTETLLINTQQTIPWQGRYPVDGRIHRFGFHFYEPVSIKAISLQATITVSEYLRLFVRDLLNPERFIPSSINWIYGARVLGVPLIFCLGIVLAAAGMLFLFRTSKRTFILLMAVCAAGTVFYDLYVTSTLADQARLSRNISALHASVYEERRSRFGKPFADLASKVEALVPKGATVFCTEDRTHTVPGEYNWISFHLFPWYDTLKGDSADLETTDFVVYYHPSKVTYIKESGSLIHSELPDLPIKVECLADISPEAKLFKVIHD